MSTELGPPFASSMNSSDADAPPVWTSDTTSDETGQPTAATSDASAGIVGPGPDPATELTEQARTSAARAARRARSIDDLPAGDDAGGGARQVYQPAITADLSGDGPAGRR